MTRDDRDWLTDDFPELRDAPPWVMEEMIFAQPQLAAPILGADRPGVTRLRNAVAGVARFADTLNKQDAQLRNLLANAAKTTDVLAKRTVLMRAVCRVLHLFHELVCS